MSEETREEIVFELRAYKVANPNWITDVEMAKVVASYNNRLASMSPAPAPGNYLSCEFYCVISIAYIYNIYIYISALDFEHIHHIFQ